MGSATSRTIGVEGSSDVLPFEGIGCGYRHVSTNPARQFTQWNPNLERTISHCYLRHYL